MKVAFPTMEQNGLDSQVYGHFGSAASFIMVDTVNTDQFELIENADRDHLHGHCQPLAALGGVQTHAVVVGGIGGGALRKLNHAGIKVYRAVEGSVAENLALIQRDQLPEFSPEHTCAGHTGNGGCSH